ncbi:MAG: glutaredoxin domain-containing protein [Anaerolineae bacterium]|nr:glutaredoxin domain-containing protein [Anaerolineae bacterium]
MANTEVKKRQPRVIVFSTPTCPHCRTAKQYLKKKGVRFTNVDISQDASAARDMKRISGQQGVPVITVGGRPIVGFDREKLDKLLNLH